MQTESTNVGGFHQLRQGVNCLTGKRRHSQQQKLSFDIHIGFFILNEWQLTAKELKMQLWRLLLKKEHAWRGKEERTYTEEGLG